MKFEAGQMVLHKLDRKRLIIITTLDLPNADGYFYTCRYVTNDGIYNSARFKECELIEDKDII